MLKLKNKLSAVILAICIGATALVSTAFAENDFLLDKKVETDCDNYLNVELPRRIKNNLLNSHSRIQSEIKKYVKTVIPEYLMANNFNGKYDISDIFPLNNFEGEDEEKYIVIISEDGNMVASLTVGFTGEDIVSNFRIETIPEVNKAIRNDDKLVFGYSNDCFLVCSSKQIEIIENPLNNDTKFTEQLHVDSEVLDKYNVSICYETNVIASSKERESIKLNTSSSSLAPNQNRFTPTAYTVNGIKQVGNGVSPAGGGLCWAASIACMGMQKNPTHTWSALDIYDLCNKSTNTHKPSGLPVGNKSWEKFALRYIVGINEKDDTALSATQIKNILGNQKPIYVAAKSTIVSGISHAVVLFNFIHTTSTTGTYIFMDPGNGTSGAGIISTQVNSSVMNNGSGLTFVARSGKSYNKWRYSIYEK